MQFKNFWAEFNKVNGTSTSGKITASGKRLTGEIEHIGDVHIARILVDGKLVAGPKKFVGGSDMTDAAEKWIDQYLGVFDKEQGGAPNDPLDLKAQTTESDNAAKDIGDPVAFKCDEDEHAKSQVKKSSTDDDYITDRVLELESKGMSTSEAIKVVAKEIGESVEHVRRWFFGKAAHSLSSDDKQIFYTEIMNRFGDDDLSWGTKARRYLESKGVSSADIDEIIDAIAEESGRMNKSLFFARQWKNIVK